MPLNDLVKDYSLNTISQKTKIPTKVLEKLVNKEWDKLQVTKAKGFIKIIERDFGIDLSQLRAEVEEYYSSHKTSEPNRPIDLVDAQSINNGSKIITNIIAIIALALVLYAIWFYFFKAKGSEFIQKELNSSSGLISESINRAKSLVGIQDNKAKVESNTTKRKKDEKKSEPKAIIVNNNSNTLLEANETNSSTIEKNETQENKKFDITTDINRSEETKNEINTTTNIDNNSSRKTEVFKLATSSEEEENKSIKVEVESLLEENRSSQSNQELNNTSMQESNATQNSDENLSEANNTNTIETIKSLTIKPRAKSIWIGVYNINKNKRYVSVASDKYHFNTQGDKIAIVTGHNRFEISTDSGINRSFVTKSKKSKRVYLLIENGEIKEITKDEYKKVTKNRAW